MRASKHFFGSISLTALLFTGFAAGGIAQVTNTNVNPETKAPAILATSPSGGEVGVDLNSAIEITFSGEMDEASINETTLQLHTTYADTMYEEHGEMMDDQMKVKPATKGSENSLEHTTRAVNGTISYSNKVAVFTPDSELKEGTLYTFTVTTGVKNSENLALENDQNWSFTTVDTSESVYSDKQNDNNGMESNEYNPSATDSTLKGKTNVIDLGNAGQFVILAKTNINNESESEITGQTGEGSVADSLKNEKNDSDTAQQTTSDQAQQTTSGQAVALQSNQSDTSTADVNEALEDMMSAYSDASMQNGDSLTTHNTESFHHDPALKPGVHEWSESLQVTSDVTLSGSADDVWIFKTGNNLTVQENTTFTLTDGARADNIFWYVEGEVTIGENAQFEGIILSMNEITLEKGAKLNGRMFSQTSITLDDNTITEPRSMRGQTSSTNE